LKEQDLTKKSGGWARKPDCPIAIGNKQVVCSQSRLASILSMLSTAVGFWSRFGHTFWYVRSIPIARSISHRWFDCLYAAVGRSETPGPTKVTRFRGSGVCSKCPESSYQSWHRGADQSDRPLLGPGGSTSTALAAANYIADQGALGLRFAIL